MDMALLSNILAAYSFVSGSCPVSAGPGLRPWAGQSHFLSGHLWPFTQEKNGMQTYQKGSVLLSFEWKIWFES